MKARVALPWQPHWIPSLLVAGVAVVIAVNGGMIYLAGRSFPGAVDNAFQRGAAYNYVLAEARREAELGWRVDARSERGGIWLTIRDRQGEPLEALAVTASVERPLGPPERQPLAFSAVAPGLYHAAATLATGQWQLTIEAGFGEDRIRTGERLIVR
jgi:nitrogen fixation protein FixH